MAAKWLIIMMSQWLFFQKIGCLVLRSVLALPLSFDAFPYLEAGLGGLIVGIQLWLFAVKCGRSCRFRAQKLQKTTIDYVNFLMGTLLPTRLRHDCSKSYIRDPPHNLELTKQLVA